MARRPQTRLGCLQLEAREVPAVVVQSFEAAPAPSLPADARQWSAAGDAPFVTTRERRQDGSQALASTGTATSDSRYWSATTYPADSRASVRLLSSGPAPLALLVRGSNLDTARPTYLAAVVTAGGRDVSLVEVVNGVSRTLGTASRLGGAFGLWFTLSVMPAGGSAAVRLQRPDTGEWLNPRGEWQADPTDAVRADTAVRADGLVGVARSPGGAGLGYFDALAVTTPDNLPQSPVPPPSGRVVESFDAVAPGAIPPGWAEWASDGTAGFGGSSVRAVSGSGLAVDGTSRLVARAWLGGVQPADVQAAASLFVDGLAPAGVVARGRDLGTPTPTYYALTAVRGTTIRLAAVVSGVETTLGTVRSTDYVSQKWLRLTLTVAGDQLRAVVTRADTGRWLTPDGDWSDVPQPALTATDARVTGGGFVGLLRGSGAAGAVNFDDLTMTPGATVAGPAVEIASNFPAEVSGDLTVRVSAPGARRVEYRLNGVLRSVASTALSSWTLDTTALANGPAVLTVRATDDAGNVGTGTATYTVNNPNPAPPPQRPDLPRHLPNIRIAQLAYSGTPFGDFERARLADSVDLVIPAPQFQAAVDAAAPGTPQLVYTNVSNLYGGLLTDWLSFADRTGTGRELAFYHVNAATPFSGGSPSSQPVNWLWQVARGGTDYTPNARGGRTTGVPFGGVGESVSLGYPERFRELNFDLNTAPGAGWRAQFEYVSRTNPDGSSAEWKPLTLLSDTTNGLARPGRVLFDPPADWAPARVNGNDLLYHVRLRTVAPGVAPVARTIFGRDYVGATGTTTGTIPAFDAAADRDNDGYLSDAEYATRRTGLDARFGYESRLFYPQYGQMRFVSNPAAGAVRRWAADYHARVMAQNPLADGFFVDNSNGRLPFAAGLVQEPTAGYADDSAGLVAAVWRAVAPKVVFSNTAGGFADATAVTRASTGVVEEFALRATDATWSAVLDTAGLVRSRLGADGPAPYTVLDTHPGNFAVTDPRYRSAALAYYYLVADPDRTMLMFSGGLNPSAAWRDTWIPAVATDIGRPLPGARGDLTTFASGSDPENPALGYKVFGREYGNALVLYKPRSYTLGVGTGTTSDATATTHQLGGSYRLLNSDNTLGPVASSVTLRNGEGAVLVRA